MLRFVLFVAVIISAAGLAAYGGIFWLINQTSTLTLVDADGKVDQQGVLELLKLVPPAMASLGAIITAGASVLIVGLQKRANTDLENLKGTVQKELAKDTRRLDIAIAQIHRHLEAISQAEETASEYVTLLYKLDSGRFETSEIEKTQDKLGQILDSLGSESPAYGPLAALIVEGNYIKERAEQRSTPQGLRKVWRESHPDSGQRLGIRLAARKDQLRKILRQEREQLLSKMGANAEKFSN